jgi:Family of unknown function (DUF6065)
VKLICYSLYPPGPLLRPAPAQRAWMDATPDAYAYRCLPLNIANAHGWEILLPRGLTAKWNGGSGREAISISLDAPREGVSSSASAISHFGSGILTFHVEAVFRTEPGWSLYVQGPANQPKHGISPLSGVIETDWAPYSFTMNWLFTAPGQVRFEAGEAFCSLFPVPRTLIDDTEPVIHSIESDPDLAERHRQWAAGRSAFNADLKVQGSAAQTEKWQKAYYRGMHPDGQPTDAGHMVKLRPKPFRDERG